MDDIKKPCFKEVHNGGIDRLEQQKETKKDMQAQRPNAMGKVETKLRQVHLKLNG